MGVFEQKRAGKRGSPLVGSLEGDFKFFKRRRNALCCPDFDLTARHFLDFTMQLFLFTQKLHSGSFCTVDVDANATPSHFQKAGHHAGFQIPD